MNDLIDRSVQVVSQQPDYVKHVADRCCKCKLVVFSGESCFLICTQKWLLRTLNFCQFQTEIIKVKWFQTEHYSIEALTTSQ